MKSGPAPEQAKAQFRTALALYQSGRLAEAAVACAQALEGDPKFFDALFLAGVLAILAEDFAKGADFLGKALAINQGNAQAYYTHGQSLWALRRHDEAVASFDRAIALKPAFPAAYTNRGNALRELRRYDAARQSYAQAIALDPNFADAHVQLGMCQLQMGDFSQGWEGYEWRWRRADAAPRQFPRPQWQGDAPLAGKTILLHDEQGLGDTLQVCRYVKLVAEQGAQVILGVQKPLVGLLTGVAGAALVKGWGDEVPAFDYHAPLMSLPRAFKTDLATIPAPGRYLHSSAEKRDAWRAVLGEPRQPRIGLAWSGATGQGINTYRSIPLDELAAYLPSGLDYISLQKDLRDADRAALQSRPDIRHFAGGLNDFTDTAALCDLVDAVVSIDTSVAHLAGALARPTKVLLLYNADWRWLLERSDSPWYPTATLFRQATHADWSVPLRQMREDLLGMLGD